MGFVSRSYVSARERGTEVEENVQETLDAPGLYISFHTPPSCRKTEPLSDLTIDH